ncbi:MAG: Pyrrolo-quinoline quinone [Novosphingobium sp.]|nr:Pyrrolo-quinoline quinone [Novosphingobium sp.]
MNGLIKSRRLAAPLLLVLALSLSGCGIFGGKGKPTTPTVGNRVPILSRIESSAKADPALRDVAVVLPPAEINPEWPQAGNTASKSYGNLALAAAPQRLWSVSITGSNSRRRLAATPVIGDGKKFVMDTDGVVHAFVAQSGAPLWTKGFQIKGNGEDSVFGGGATFDGGRVYITTGVGDVAALDAKTGNQIWKIKPAGPLRGSPTVALNAVYVMTQNNEIYALNSDDGAQLWNETGSLGQAGVFGVAAPAVGQGTIVAGYSSGELSAYRYENGRGLWSDALARTSLATTVGVLTDVDADPIIDRGRVFALGQGGRMAAYEMVSGQRIWELNLAGISTPAIAGDWIFVLTDEAKLLCIARTTGKVRWVTQLQRYKNDEKRKNPYYWSGPTLANGRLWMTNSQGEVYSVGAADGVATQFTKVGDPFSHAPVVAGQIMYLMDDGGHISAYR